MGQNTTHFTGASFWNDLSDDVRSMTDEKEFIMASNDPRCIHIFTVNPQRAHSSTSLIDYSLIRNTPLINRYPTTNKNKTIKQFIFIYSHSLLISSSRLPIANTCQTYSFISWHMIIHLFLFPNLCSTFFYQFVFSLQLIIRKSFLYKHLSNVYMDVLWKITTVYSVPG